MAAHLAAHLAVGKCKCLSSLVTAWLGYIISTTAALDGWMDGYQQKVVRTHGASQFVA